MNNQTHRVVINEISSQARRYIWTNLYIQFNTKGCDRHMYKTDRKIIWTILTKRVVITVQNVQERKNNLQIHVKRHTSENNYAVRNVGNQATPLVDNKPINTKCIHAKCWLVTKVILNFDISAIQGYI